MNYKQLWCKFKKSQYNCYIMLLLFKSCIIVFSSRTVPLVRKCNNVRHLHHSVVCIEQLMIIVKLKNLKYYICRFCVNINIQLWWVYVPPMANGKIHQLYFDSYERHWMFKIMYKIVFCFQHYIAYCFIYATESMNYSAYMYMYVVNIMN